MKIISKPKDQVSVCLKDLTRNEAVLENLMIDADLSLRKRNGYKRLFDLSIAPSSVYVNGSSPYHSVHAVRGSCVCALDLENLCEAAVPSEKESPGGYSSVVRFKNETLIFDGDRVSKLEDGKAVPLSPYVPLCASMWKSGERGEIYEGRNLLSNHFRATYDLDASPELLYLPFKADRIDCIIYDGSAIDENEYELSEDGMSIICSFPNDQSVITVYASFDESFVLDGDLASCSSAVSSDHESATLFAFGSPGREAEEYVFVSNATDKAQRDDFASSLYGVNSELCFFEDSKLRVGSRKKITAVKCIGDDVLLFTEDECWLSRDGEAPVILSMGSGAACNESVVLYRGDVVFAGKSGIFRMSLADSKENVKIETVSDSSVFPNAFLEGARLCLDGVSNVLLIYNELYGDGAFAYSFETKALSHFTGFSPHVMFCFGGKTYFTTDNTLFVFSKDSCFDSPDGEARIPVKALFKSKILDLGEPFNEKKLSSLSLRATSGSQKLSVTVELDGRKKEDVKLKAVSSPFPNVFLRKLPPHRFSSVTVGISDGSEGELHVSAFELRARKLKRK